MASSIDGRLIAGLPVKVEKANIAISQPKVIDVCAFGEQDFLTDVNIFTRADIFADKIKVGDSRLQSLSDFHVLMYAIEQDSTMRDDVIMPFFDLILPDYDKRIESGCIQFMRKGDGSRRVIGQLNPVNLCDFSEILGTMFLPYEDSGEEKFNPINDKAQEIAEKLNKARQRRNELKHKDKKTGAVATSVFSNYISVLSVGVGIDANILLRYTPFQLYDSYKRFVAKVAYENWERMVTIPFADSSSIEQPQNWMGMLSQKDN